LGFLNVKLGRSLNIDIPYVIRDAMAMPRKSRIDADGAAHYIVVRGIGRSRIFTVTGGNVVKQSNNF
jgi:hypothetical protein